MWCVRARSRAYKGANRKVQAIYTVSSNKRKKLSDMKRGKKKKENNDLLPNKG